MQRVKIFPNRGQALLQCIVWRLGTSKQMFEFPEFQFGNLQPGQNVRTLRQHLAHFWRTATILHCIAKSIRQCLGELTPKMLKGGSHLHFDEEALMAHNHVHRSISVTWLFPSVLDFHI